MSSQSLEKFWAAFQRVNGQLHIGQALHGNSLAGLDMSEAFRASLVLGVSALDSYIHNLCVEAIIESFANLRSRNSYFGEVRISLLGAEYGIPSGTYGWLEGEVRELFSRETFQRPDDIARALRFVDGEPKRWSRIAAQFGSSPSELRVRLSNIVDRRNMIVHEADIDPVWGVARPLEPVEVQHAIMFLSDFVNAIETTCW